MMSQGPSPDEVALVEGASRLGFKLTQRTSSFLTLSFQGEVCIPKPLFDILWTLHRVFWVRDRHLGDACNLQGE